MVSLRVRILLVDDHAIVRDGLRAIFSRLAEFEIVGEADTGLRAIEQASHLTPHVVVMDILMPELDGIAATRRIIKANPGVKVIALSANSDRAVIEAAMQAGASAYVLKNHTADELLRAIRTALCGQKHAGSILTDVYIDPSPGRPSRSRRIKAPISQREREVLQLLAQGKTSKQIGAMLGITENTIEVHRRNISRKLNLHSVAELTRYAVREGITEP